MRNGIKMNLNLVNLVCETRGRVGMGPREMPYFMDTIGVRTEVNTQLCEDFPDRGNKK